MRGKQRFHIGETLVSSIGNNSFKPSGTGVSRGKKLQETTGDGSRGPHEWIRRNA